VSRPESNRSTRVVLAALLLAVCMGCDQQEGGERDNMGAAVVETKGKTEDKQEPHTATRSKDAGATAPEPRLDPQRGILDHAKRLLPLAVGNSWTYRWSSPGAPKEGEFQYPDARSRCMTEWKYDDLQMIVHSVRGKGREHTETYRITRQDGDRFFFEVSSSPKVGKQQLRDGRYAYSQEIAWRWWQNGATLGLIESIKREVLFRSASELSDFPLDRILRDLPPGQYAAFSVEYGNGTRSHLRFRSDFNRKAKIEPPNLPSDDRILIQDSGKHGGLWTVERGVGRRGEERLVTEYTNHGSSKSIRVPAGTFEGCVQTAVKCSTSKAKQSPLSTQWEIHTFWAPEVGMVREYQKLDDGTLVYELTLVSYRISPGDQNHAKD